jgi:hypothetical protein
MFVYIPQDENISLNLESETNALVQAGLENLAVSEALDFLGLEARMTGILRQELERLGKLGPGLLWEA